MSKAKSQARLGADGVKQGSIAPKTQTQTQTQTSWLRRRFLSFDSQTISEEHEATEETQTGKNKSKKVRLQRSYRRSCWNCCSYLLAVLAIVLLTFNLVVLLDSRGYLNYFEPHSANNETADRVLEFMQLHGKTNTQKGKTMLQNVTALKHANLSSIYWQFISQISQYALYSMETTNNGQLVDKLVHAMAHNPIVALESMGKVGSEWKMFGTLKDTVKVVFKPARMNRDEYVDPNLYYFAEKERHFGEIAAYHLDRILGFNRVPPCVGRTINITSDMIPHIDDQFMLTVHRSPNNSLCFYGKCLYLCDLFHPICGKPDTVEFSACALIPMEVWKMNNIISPWRRTYTVKNQKIPDWEKLENFDSFCKNHVLNDTMYSTGRRLLDLVDLHVFDFLTGNQDRHSYFVHKAFENDSAMINFDNGRGFGRPYFDDITILAPLSQCCVIRRSTYEKIVFFSQNRIGVRLSDLMRRSLTKDPLSKVAPILTEAHLVSLDRRVKAINEAIARDCMLRRNLKVNDILVDDGF